MLKILNMNEYISLNHYLILSSLVFTIGMFGLFMNRKNIINILMSIELMLLAVNINFVAFSVYMQELSGQIFSIIILTVAAAETAIGLAILLIYFRNKGSIKITDINKMRG
ncbi:NADH dehydrogenase I chain K [Rickettsia prowazekii str. Rp22]|uniref:NADH-quinone oxidoreductase subunit K n=3 Tax=Rickettsia prowazekii TaxID=782 RepID=NUOK_RICPR|nr:RecName: Full=NADH-quinone oxidoreductase subunit K; AltName: Full=NADH dehydrogenase I subunit K; AltName: Full=NDH-1 subunit K [Rickettsia prowazekii str. Madrid E]ADE30355.1 NADH dehydrogenase I chain K [Rickettsia prowazekii str. Rp22]CAA15217.1 NADH DEHYDROGENASE I CHAIN K (nuoK) [Rickettsia prowazekii str. Madrid E]